jgi:hypothetical protein
MGAVAAKGFLLTMKSQKLDALGYFNEIRHQLVLREIACWIRCR